MLYETDGKDWNGRSYLNPNFGRSATKKDFRYNKNRRKMSKLSRRKNRGQR